MVRNSPSDFDPESAIIDADLLVKYRMVNRAIEALERAIDSAPRHFGLREKLREVLIDAGRRDQAAQRCLELASLYIQAGDMEKANERLLEAKRHDPRVSVTGQLRDVRRTDVPTPSSQRILSGALTDINLFDIMQIVENSRLSGSLLIMSSAANGEIYFNEGQIVGANAGPEPGIQSLALLLEAVDGTFEFDKSTVTFERTIVASSNTALILDMLRAKDERDHGMSVLDPF